ncbi:ABC transporter ATP-binding protein [Roseospira visakhapatnamensis]|uniref:Iron(III) transport system ATP-binding protein n=1 Tax=Roseospira visakhapatnamensis TaxID=390880 RepID=A0A7W6W9A2_9PROT|nr:ABC transporter ATP-binding protein [Roseospira visakhapatnamensis]MBB4265232.1 iron(III) transport system ATP-binding protein [Roseospira visakhapatnamensis]
MTGTIAAAPPALRFEDVTHGYHAAAPVVRALSLSLARGEVVCLLGPSGCGKTTTLRLAAGLDRPWAGRVDIAGRRVEDAGPTHVPPERRRVGFLFQDFALFPHLSVLGNVLFGLKDRPRRAARARALAMLGTVGLAERAGAYPHQLSGGQQQRVALARALAPEPALLLLDEPFSGLDTRLRRAVREQTLRVLQQSGVAALMVTHDPEEAMFMADRVALMQAGRVEQIDSPMQLHHRPRSAFAVRFFSEVNECVGRVEGGRVATPLGLFDAPDLAEGAAARVLARPEALIPTLAGETGFAARVVSVRPLGHETILLLGLTRPGSDEPVMPLTARVPGRPTCAPGDLLGLAIETDECFVFPDEGPDDTAEAPPMAAP